MRIGLLELTTYHEECLYSQLRFLKDAGHEVELFLNPGLEKQVAVYAALAKQCHYFDFSSRTPFHLRIRRFLSFYKAITTGNFDVLIFNTANSKKELLLLCLLLPKNKPVLIGTLHDLSKLKTSYTQKIFTRSLKHYFVLNDYLMQNHKKPSRRVSITAYYPIFFPQFPKFPIHKPAEEKWVCIPGSIDYNRRNYKEVLEVLQLLPENSKLRFILLGKAEAKDARSRQFMKDLADSVSAQHVLSFDTFISNEVFHAYVRASDCIFLPLVAKEDGYQKSKITGGVNLAIAYGKPLICPEFMKVVPDLRKWAYFYESTPTLMALFNNLEFKNADRTHFREGKWEYAYQKDNYIAVINNLMR